MVTRRRERLRQEIRDEILAAARDLFVNEGYASVGMRRIADSVGCAPGTLYLHFPDKDAIFNAICEETFQILNRRMQAIAGDQADPIERIRRAGRQYIQFGLDHPHHYWLTFGPREKVVPKAKPVMDTGMNCFDCLRQLVRAGIEAGQIRNPDVEEIAQSLWAPMHGVVMLLIAKPDFPFIEHQRLIDSVLDIVIEGIRKT